MVECVIVAFGRVYVCIQHIKPKWKPKKKQQPDVKWTEKRWKVHHMHRILKLYGERATELNSQNRFSIEISIMHFDDKSIPLRDTR